MFQKLLHKVGQSEIKYIKILGNYKALEISVGNSYSEDQLMHTLFEIFQKRGQYSDKIAIRQEDFSREGK